jgi:D-serine deaminase-like pyridoxal phosphate-dependent protein
MTTVQTALSLPTLDLDEYRIREVERILTPALAVYPEIVERILTPALAVYPEIVDQNIQLTLKLLDGDAKRWRPHVKTAKLEFVMRRYLEHGVTSFKCSTSLELLTLCRIGVPDALIAYPLVGANARRVRQLAEQFPHTKISALVETIDQVASWESSRVSLFIDVNPGMDRTGIAQDEVAGILGLAECIVRAGCEFRGLHYYDGHLGRFDLKERELAAHMGYSHLMELVQAIKKKSIFVEEVITAGTPAFPCTLTYQGFKGASFIHRASPGTIVYADCTSLSQLPAAWAYHPAAVVISTVVSHPSAGRITCDAGHKTVSADAGSPTCSVIGWPDLVPAKPSEEHLPLDANSGRLPAIGETLYLVPRHVCPTINNFDDALLVSRGRIVGTEKVTARGREFPLIS